MKKVLAIAVLGVFVLTSCKKDRTCTCTDSDGTSWKYTYAKSKKKDAEAACDSWSSVYALGGGSCKLD